METCSKWKPFDAFKEWRGKQFKEKESAQKRNMNWINIFPIGVSTSLYLLLSLLNTTPRYLKHLHLLQYMYCGLQHTQLTFLERHTSNTSLVSLLIFIPTWLHTAEKRSSVCWTPCSEDVSSNKSSAQSPIPTANSYGLTLLTRI